MRSAWFLALASIAIVGVIVAAPSAPKIPSGAGVCWRHEGDRNGQPMFSVLATNIENMETCGARLEAVRLMTNLPVSGAYQGFRVFADEAAISASATMNGPRQELISQADRVRLGAAIAELIARRSPPTSS